MQMMVIEFARDVLGYADADSSEMCADTPHNVIDMMEEQTRGISLQAPSRKSRF